MRKYMFDRFTTVNTRKSDYKTRLYYYSGWKLKKFRQKNKQAMKPFRSNKFVKILLEINKILQFRQQNN